jgi:hypothetical protein
MDTVGHLVSDESEEELHAFAKKLGLKREWFQDKRLSHYDVTTVKMRAKAKKLGAKIVSSKEIVAIINSLNKDEIISL